MARALMRALSSKGHEVALVSDLRLFLGSPDADRQSALTLTAQKEVDRISQCWGRTSRPELWFTYHNHYKAPDLLGPRLCGRFNIPYVVAEASYAPRRTQEWTTWHQAAEEAIRMADVHVCFTARDRAGIASLVRPTATILDLPPFIDVADVSVPERRDGRPVRLIAVAMMRAGDKLASYRLLAESLRLIAGRDWHLDIVGDGPARPDVVAAFSRVPPYRVTWHGAVSGPEVLDRLMKADVFVWPGFGEAFGLAYLEAQAAGLPVVGLDTAGVSSVVRSDQTGILVTGSTPAIYAAAIERLVDNADQRLRLGRAAAQFVRTERTLDIAAAALDRTLRAAVDRHNA
ncbi:glycosyltransferase family 4 protein [Lichenifustis flavocetrariae]